VAILGENGASKTTLLRAPARIGSRPGAAGSDVTGRAAIRAWAHPGRACAPMLPQRPDCVPQRARRARTRTTAAGDVGDPGIADAGCG
jgi:ABC-type multidrug transport system ATPase subunit